MRFINELVCFLTFRYVTKEDHARALINFTSMMSTCQFTRVPSDFLMDHHHDVFHDSMAGLRECLGHNSLSSLSNLREALHRSTGPNRTQIANELNSVSGKVTVCLEQQRKLCLSSSVIVIKSIRLKMRHVQSLLSLFPNMKVIHLVRDPRGMFNSQNDVGNGKDMRGIVSECHALTSNLILSKSIFTEGGESALTTVRYEDLAENPLQTAKRLFEFIGVEFSSYIQQYVKNITSAEANNDAFGVRRKDSTATANRWRTMIDFKSVELIDSICSFSSNILGYLPFSSNTDLKNGTIPSRTWTNITNHLMYDNRF